MSSKRASLGQRADGLLSTAANRTAQTLTGKAEREVTRLPIEQLRRDGGTQPRAGLDAAVVAEYAEVLSGGGALPPIEVVYDGTDYWLWDGYHRLAAAEQEGEAEYDCLVTPGTRRDAVLKSVGANADHGLRRTNEDKRRAVETLLNDFEWSGWSDREIARTCKVSHTFVANMRSELTGNGCQSDDEDGGGPAVRRGADGRAIDVSNIQAANQLRAAREALEKLDLPPLEPGSTEYEEMHELLRRLNTSLSDFKLVAGAAGRLRPYLPYALQAEVAAGAAPRMSYVNWMRAELPKWQEEQFQQRQAQDEPGKTAQANAKLAAKIDELREAVLAVVEGQPPMKWREIEFAVNARLGRIANPGLLSGAINVLTQTGLLQNVGGGRYALPGAAEVEPVQNGSGWLDEPVGRGATPAMAIAANGGPAHSDNHDAALNDAYLAEAQLSGALLKLTDAADKVLAIQGIRALYALPEARMRNLSEALYLLSQMASDLKDYAETQHERLRLMARTGRPYDEEDEA